MCGKVLRRFHLGSTIDAQRYLIGFASASDPDTFKLSMTLSSPRTSVSQLLDVSLALVASLLASQFLSPSPFLNRSVVQFSVSQFFRLSISLSRSAVPPTPPQPSDLSVSLLDDSYVGDIRNY